ncbi:unnamed protein product [Peniophora sp. CBMAI 1063]|nr:unnamed protein product [Peniophora sp. CBMAI 1063]
MFQLSRGAIQRAVRAPKSTRMMSSGHGHYNHLPFKWDTTKQFAVRYIPFMALGTVIPFAACYYKIKRFPQ